MKRKIGVELLHRTMRRIGSGAPDDFLADPATSMDEDPECFFSDHYYIYIYNIGVQDQTKNGL